LLELLETQTRRNHCHFWLFVIFDLEAIGILLASIDITRMALLQRLAIDFAAIEKPATVVSHHLARSHSANANFNCNGFLRVTVS